MSLRTKAQGSVDSVPAFYFCQEHAFPTAHLCCVSGDGLKVRNVELRSQAASVRTEMLGVESRLGMVTVLEPVLISKRVSGARVLDLVGVWNFLE